MKVGWGGVFGGVGCGVGRGVKMKFVIFSEPKLFPKSALEMHFFIEHFLKSFLSDTRNYLHKYKMDAALSEV